MRHWSIIETGGSQAYVFGTNRLRHVVGASYLVYLVGVEWVPNAARRFGATVVMSISGKAILLVDDPAGGQAVIDEVSVRALREAPGLEVTGVVGPGFDPALEWEPASPASAPGVGGGRPFTHVEALTRTYELLEAVRVARPSPQLRDPLLPWFEVCRDSGYPAAGVERAAGSGVPGADDERPADRRYAAAPVLAKSAVRGRARDRMRDLLGDVPEVVPAGLDDLRLDGWMAVIHADGNGVGQVFTQFPELALRAVGVLGDGGPGARAAGLSLDRHADLLRRFTVELDRATEAALGIAVREVTAGQDADATILPVVVGGDDVTVVCHARFALPLARALALAFQEQTALRSTVAAITGGGLTAAAGIAYVKPHHPFSAAYGLAEELTVSAKRVKEAGGHPVSALDLHVAFESTLTDLAGLRERLAVGGIARYGGPYVITVEESPLVGPQDIADLDRAMRTVSALSSSMAHYLREGLAAGREEYGRRISRAARSPGLPPGIQPADIEDLAPVAVAADDSMTGQAGGEAGEVLSVRMLDAFLLSGLSRPALGGHDDPAQDAGPGPQPAGAGATR